MRLRVLQQAESEAIDAAEWYEGRISGLGSAFVRDYEAALRRIEAEPESFGRLETAPELREIRRVLLRRFPYLVVYEILLDEVMVLAVAHVSRRPNYWIDRGD